MKSNRRLLYLYSLLTTKKIILFSLITFFFTSFNLIYQYFILAQKFGNLSILLLGDSGIIWGALNGFCLAFYLLPLIGLAVFIKNWTSTPFFLISSKSKIKVFTYQTVALLVGTLFYFLILFLCIFIAYFLIVQFGVIGRNQISWDLSEILKILFFKYMQFVLIGQFILLGRNWLNEYILLIITLVPFCYCILVVPPFLTPIFFLARGQMLDNTLYFNNLLFLVLVILVIILLLIATQKYTDRGNSIDA